MGRKKKITSPVEIDDVIVMRDWNNQWVSIKVQKLSDSKVHGSCVEGVDVDEGQYRALPLSHKVETARVQKVKRGTWDIEWPDGKVEHFKGSLAAVKTLCQERGTVMTEV